MIRNISWEKQKPNHLLVLHGLGTRAFVLWSFRTSASITSVQVCLKTTKFYLDTCLLLMQTYSITTRFLHKCKKIIDQLDWINDTWNTVLHDILYFQLSLSIRFHDEEQTEETHLSILQNLSNILHTAVRFAS